MRAPDLARLSGTWGSAPRPRRRRQVRRAARRLGRPGDDWRTTPSRCRGTTRPCCAASRARRGPRGRRRAGGAGRRRALRRRARALAAADRAAAGAGGRRLRPAGGAGLQGVPRGLDVAPRRRAERKFALARRDGGRRPARASGEAAAGQAAVGGREPLGDHVGRRRHAARTRSRWRGRSACRRVRARRARGHVPAGPHDRPAERLRRPRPAAPRRGRRALRARVAVRLPPVMRPRAAVRVPALRGGLQQRARRVPERAGAQVAARAGRARGRRGRRRDGPGRRARRRAVGRADDVRRAHLEARGRGLARGERPRRRPRAARARDVAGRRYPDEDSC